jgi:hypothetical protein
LSAFAVVDFGCPETEAIVAFFTKAFGFGTVIEDSGFDGVEGIVIE